MKRRIAAWFLLSLALAIAIAVAWHFRSKPSYQGKPIVAWAVELLGPTETASATRVFQELGPDAAPILAKAAVRSDTFLTKTVRAISRRLSRENQARLFQTFDPERDEKIRMGAVAALELMGTNAAPAAPQLSIALRSSTPVVSMRAARALGRIGKPGLPILIAALQDPDPFVRRMALHGIALMGQKAVAAVPALIAHMEDPTAPAPAEAAAAISRMGRPAVQPLVEWLRTNNQPATQIIAIGALGEIGPLARDSKPALIQIIDSSGNAEVRQAAADALKRICPGEGNAPVVER